MREERLLRRVCGVGCAVLLFAVVETLHGSVILGVESQSGNLYRIATTDAALTLVAHTGLPLGALLQAPNGMLYGYTIGTMPVLHRIDPNTGEHTAIAPITATGGIFLFEGALALSPDGTAYGLNFGSRSDNSLFTLDLDTGVATPVKRLKNGSHDINGMVWRSDGKLVATDTAQNAIIEIDPATGDSTVLHDLSTPSLGPKPVLGAIGDMTAIGDIGYFSTAGPAASPAGSNELYQLDLFTGVPVRIGAIALSPSALGIGALALPEPGALALLALGSLLVGRRKR